MEKNKQTSDRMLPHRVAAVQRNSEIGEGKKSEGDFGRKGEEDQAPFVSLGPKSLGRQKGTEVGDFEDALDEI